MKALKKMGFRKAAGLLGAAVVASALSAGVGAPAQAETTVTLGTTYKMNEGHSPAPCMDVKDFSTSPGAHLQVFSCSPNSNQKFQFIPASNDGVNQYYQIQNVSSRLCFELPAGFPNPNDFVEQANCSGFDTEQYRIVDLTLISPFSGLVAFVNKANPGRCLDAGTRDGDWLMLDPCDFNSSFFAWNMFSVNP